MNKKTYLTEEHIVAYLDGEVSFPGKEVRAALAADPALAQAALDYHGLRKAFVASAHDPRFALAPEADRAALKALREALRTSRNVVRVPARAHDAESIRPARRALPLLGQLWFKRTSVSLAFAVLIGALFISLTKNEIKVEPSVVDKSPVVSAPASQTVTPAPSSDKPVASSEQQNQAVPASENKTVAPVVTRTPAALPAPSPKTDAPLAQNIPPTSNTVASDPQDIMISRRFAKMIKDTRVVEVTQQDKM